MIKKRVLASIATVALLSSASFSAEVNITPDMKYLDIEQAGKSIRIQRIQNTKNRLTNSYTKTSRPCPPFCIHPMNVADGVKTVGELELLEFLDKKVKTNEGLLIDSRMPQWYNNGTIPGALNIPFTLLKSQDNVYLDKILQLLGGTKKGNKWDFGNAQELLMFCNGPWCDQSPRAIKSLLEVGYPANKLLYYRGGMQNWQLLGLTTVVPK